MASRVVVLISGTGTLLQALLDAASEPDAGYTVVAVGADRPDAPGLLRGLNAGVPIFSVPMLRDRTEWDACLADAVAQYRPDVVVSAGFMKLVGAEFLSRYGGRFINSHPALLPSFPGMHGVRDALAAGVKVSGTTIFMVDEGVDTGRILAQQAVDVLPDDSEDSLHERIKVVERELLVAVVKQLAATASEPNQKESNV